MAQTSAPRRPSEPSVSTADQREIAALTNDVQRMRSLVRQMEMNLALVQTTQTPLKHQFELEIDSWRVVLDGMERRLQHLRGASTGGVVSPVTVPLQLDSRQGKP